MAYKSAGCYWNQWNIFGSWHRIWWKWFDLSAIESIESGHSKNSGRIYHISWVASLLHWNHRIQVAGTGAAAAHCKWCHHRTTTITNQFEGESARRSIPRGRWNSQRWRKSISRWCPTHQRSYWPWLDHRKYIDMKSAVNWTQINYWTFFRRPQTTNNYPFQLKRRIFITFWSHCIHDHSNWNRSNRKFPAAWISFWKCRFTIIWAMNFRMPSRIRRF